MPTLHRTLQLGVFCAFLTLAACASINSEINERAPYPANWPRPTRLAPVDCPDLSGTFEDVAAEVFPPSLSSGADARSSLAAIIAQVRRATTRNEVRKLDVRPKSMPDLRTVELALTTNTLRVRPLPPEGADIEFTFRRTRSELLEIRLSDAFTCSVSDLGAELRFLAEIDSVAGGAAFIGFGQSKITVSLFRSSDQSLIVRWNKQNAGIVILVPYVTNESTWLRFRKIEHSSN